MSARRHLRTIVAVARENSWPMVLERLKRWEMVPGMALASQRRFLAKRRSLAEKGMA